MGAILKQLGLDYSFFIQLILIAAFYFAVVRIFFRPFQRLLERRHARTVEDRKAAEALFSQAQTQMAEYERRLNQEKKAAQAQVEASLAQVKQQEGALLQRARDQAKEVTQAALKDLEGQRQRLRKELLGEVDGFAKSVAERLLSK